jgi:hypothetical protein
MKVLFGPVAAPRRGRHEPVTGMSKSLRSLVPASGPLGRLALPNALASPAPGLGLKAWAAANADPAGSIATPGGEAQGGQTRPTVPRAVGPPSGIARDVLA